MTDTATAAKDDRLFPIPVGHTTPSESSNKSEGDLRLAVPSVEAFDDAELTNELEPLFLRAAYAAAGATAELDAIVRKQTPNQPTLTPSEIDISQNKLVLAPSRADNASIMDDAVKAQISALARQVQSLANSAGEPVANVLNAIVTEAINAAGEITPHAEPSSETFPSTVHPITADQVRTEKDKLRLEGLQLEYMQRLEAIALFPDKIENRMHYLEAGKLASTFQQIQKLQRKLGFDVMEKHPRVRKAERMRVAYDRAQRKLGTTSTSPRRIRQVVAPSPA